MKKERFTIELSVLKKYWVCTDVENFIVCTFKDKKFNETQTFTPLKEMPNVTATQLATIAGEMGDWLRENHYNKVL